MKKYRSSCLVLLFLFFLLNVSGTLVAAVPVLSQTKLIADDAFKDSGFGWAVAVDGDTAVVSAFADYDNLGAAYVYERTAGGWQQVAKLTASDGVDGDNGDFLGISLAVSGDTVVLGAALDDNENGTDAGAVYVYVKPAGGWPAAMTETVKLVAPVAAADRGFGSALALEGDTLVVGSPGKDDALVPGEVFVYQGGGDSWTLKATLSVSGLNGSDSFGTILDFDGQTIAVGAFGQDGSKGAVYLYRKPSGGWSSKSHDVMLVAADGQANDFFGGSVAVDGDTVLVGANGDDDHGSKSGAAYVFVQTGSSWVQQAKLTASDAKAADNFGYSVDLAGNSAVIGGKITDPDAKTGSKFGLSVAIDSTATVVLAGAFGADAGPGRAEKNAGAAYLFELEAPVDLALVKQDDRDPVRVGESLTYTLLITNNGERDATGVTVSDTLPDEVSYLSDDSGCSRNGQIITCNLGTVGKNGGKASVAITVSADSAGSIVNTATVSANEVEADSTDNTDSETTLIKANAPPQAVDDTVITDEDTPG